MVVKASKPGPTPKPSRAADDCPVAAYARDVVGGRILAGKWVRLACKRHLEDLKTGHLRGLSWDSDASTHAIGFFSFLRHSKGRWNDDPFTLSPWQAFIVGCLFGWKRADGTRRFRIAFVEVPRKNGKTTLAAGIMLYCLIADGEAGAEVYAAATKRDQARLVFDDAKAMVGRSPALSEIVTRYRLSIQIPEARAKFEPIASDHSKADGLNPSAFVADEIHAWKSRDLWDVLLTGMGAREQPLALAITTAGDFADSIYNELHNDSEQILDGVVADDAVFAFVATPDSDDDWKTEAAWVKANPNIGVSLKVEELRETIRKAERTPSEQNKVKRLRLNIRTAALNSWLRLDQWDKGGQPFDAADLIGKPCWGGLDLASTSDLAAFILAFPWGGSAGAVAYRLRAWLWCPADGEGQAQEKLRRRLFPWAQAGLVEMTAGNAIDIDRIESTVRQAGIDYDLRGVCYDPFNAESTAGRLAGDGIKMLRFPQNASNFNEPTRAFEAAVNGGRLLHGGNPVLRWMASNVVILENGAGHLMPSRKKSREKIDGIVAGVMSVACHLKTDGAGGSVYDERGVD